MSAFGGLILTNQGRNLQVKAQTGVQLQFTRIAIGDGSLGGTSILELNSLISEKKSLTISKLKVLTDGKATVGAVLSNQDITSGFYFREIGVFANDPDLGEILYCYGNAGDTADYIPAGSNGGSDLIEKSIDVITIVGNAESVTATIDSSMVFETPEGAQEKADKAEANAKTYSDDKLASHQADYVKHITQEERKKWNDATSQFSVYKSGKDSNGIFTIVEYKRDDGTLYARSVLSGGTSPQYTTRTITYYAADGTTVLKTDTFILTYDVDGELISEVKQ